MQNEHELWIASRQYVKGEIDAEALKAVEDPYTNAFNRSVRNLVKHQMRCKIVSFMKRIVKWNILLNVQ
jgi:hypothetical protein